MRRQVAALQEWRAALWRLCHGSLTARGAPSAAALRPEPLAHAWLCLRKALQGLTAAAPAAAVLPEAAPLRSAAGRMDRALGLDAGLPAKPYLWRAGGHPVPPPTRALCGAAARLAALAELTRARTGEWGPADPSDPSSAWEPRPDPASRLAAAGIELPHGALQLAEAAEAVAEEVPAHESPATAAAAALSADWGLRQALLEGLGFFALAVQRLREGGLLGSAAAEAPEREALEVVQLLEGKVQARAREVRCRKGARALQHGPGPAAIHAEQSLFLETFTYMLIGKYQCIQAPHQPCCLPQDFSTLLECVLEPAIGLKNPLRYYRHFAAHALRKYQFCWE